jgi:ribosomal protein S18 acetylase RimI-like enzyme
VPVAPPVSSTTEGHPLVRPATRADLAALHRLEQAEFTGDRLSWRSLRRLLSSPGASIMAAVAADRIVGYAMVLFRKGSGIARLYSLVRASDHKGHGLGAILLLAAEQEAAARGASEMRLEVRPDNAAARRLYEHHGYVVSARTADYYEDHSDALRMRKPLSGPAR